MKKIEAKGQQGEQLAFCQIVGYGRRAIASHWLALVVRPQASNQQSKAGHPTLTSPRPEIERPGPVSNHWLPASLRRLPITPPLQNSLSSSCPHFWAHMVNSYWLTPALACPTQASPKIFISPKLLLQMSKYYKYCTPTKLILKHMFSKSFKKSKINDIK
jgi:hypothetical protein